MWPWCFDVKFSQKCKHCISFNYIFSCASKSSLIYFIFCEFCCKLLFSVQIHHLISNCIISTNKVKLDINKFIFTLISGMLLSPNSRISNNFVISTTLSFLFCKLVFWKVICRVFSFLVRPCNIQHLGKATHKVCFFPYTLTRGSSICDVTQFLTFFDLPSPIVKLFITNALVLWAQNHWPPPSRTVTSFMDDQ